MVTGHRDVTIGGIDYARSAIDYVCQKFGPDLEAVCGMARGADLCFASVVIGKGIPLVAAIPCEEQSKFWRRGDQEEYQRCMSKATTVVDVWKAGRAPLHNISGLMIQRDQWMVDWASTDPKAIFLAVWDGRRHGGTWHTTNMILKKGRSVMRICPNDKRVTLLTP